ncbi:flagellar hook protein FlgE [Bordetella sp. N]|uniref:flagellar hook protein FlgE n=1 Tax=Bordetella sp. N TaxID=1746199 RepID=UPI00070D5C78|nr:flagellar hook protein FlgE [Bordetella sp. N]ALM83194.1 flagellar biosynthesis protein FlgE [Bordetella sp. N]
MGFGQGLSGLNAAAQNLDVIGNNIANSGTVGFKASSVQFADVYASSRVGLGVKVSGVQQRFTVGTISSGGQYDMAIDGANGFFRTIDASGNVFYTRNGQFSIDKNLDIVNAQGQYLTGYGTGGIGTAPIQLSLPQANIAPQATSTAGFVANLNANATVIDGTATPFDATNADTYTDTQPMTVYDSLGNSHQLTQYFAKRASDTTTGDSVYDVYYTLDGQAMTPASTQLTFDSAGRLTSTPATVSVGLANPGGTASPADPLSVAINYTGSTQYGSDFTSSKTPNGYTSGEFNSISFGTDGSIIASYSNGQTQNVGTVVLANFNNVQGLKPVGDNAWTESADSGAAQLGQPGTNGMALIRGQAVEESNVDLSSELVNMIVAQRTYQANTQTIKTQSDVLQNLLQIA